MKAEDDAEAAAGPRVQDAAETEAVSPAAAGENTPGSPSSRREQDGEAAEAGAGVWPREVPRHRSSISSTGSGEIEEQPVLAERPPMYSLGLTACSPVEDAQESMASSPQYQEILQFFSGNPSVQQFKGEVRICRNGTDGHLSQERNTQLCVLAVPIFMTIADFFRFIGPCVDHIQHMRIVHDESRARYIVLMDFDTQQNADEMYVEFNGKPYSSMAAERCIVMFIKDVNFLDDGSAAKGGRPGETMMRAGGGGFPSETQTELPSCPVCLERLDYSVTGIMTTICNHSFHCRCLSDWPDTSCPVCRYCQQPESGEACAICGATDDLWMCIICGFVGCGRYNDGHALEHYRESSHTFSIELESQRVWDYSGDNYVHRLVANRLDGKLVELPEGQGREVPRRGKEASEDDDKMGEAMMASKMDNVLLQYNDMLTRTLEAQRIFFEGRLGAMQEQWEKERVELVSKLEEQQRAIADKDAALEALRKDKQKDDKKMAAVSAKLKKAWEEGEFHKQLNAQLTENQQGYLSQLAEAASKDAQIKELQEQVRDLMFYLEAQKSVENSEDSEEIKNGQIMVQQAAAGRRRPRRDQR